MKRISCLVITGVLAAMLIGCASEIPELSEKETEMVTEYAAGTVLEHVPSSGSRLVDTSVEYNPDKMTKYEKEQMGIKEPEPEPAPAPAPDETTEKDESSDEQEPKDDNAQQSDGAKPAESAFSAAQVLEIPGLAMQVDHFSVCDSYPEQTDENMFFAMDASSGNKLIVAHLKVKNFASSPIVINTVKRSDVHYKIVMNGENTQNTLLTLLLDDFSGLKDQEVAPGEDFNAVLVAQVSEEMAASVSKVAIEIQSDIGKTLVDEKVNSAGEDVNAPAPAPQEPEMQESETPEMQEIPETPAPEGSEADTGANGQ